MAEHAVLITGADGYLGSRLVARYLAETEHPLVLWVRATGEGERREKQQRLLARFPGHARRLRVHAGDLRDRRPFATLEPRDFGTIVHSAAHIRFDAARARAEAVNVEGSARLLEFARCCPRLESVSLISSIYAAGLLTGPVVEQALAPHEFANEYERSKWLAERLAFSSGLPCHVFRVATVLADDDQGRVGQYNFAHRTLELLHGGLLSVFPGDPEALAYLVTAELVTSCVLGVLEGRHAPGVWHVCPNTQQALSLDTLLDVAGRAFERDPAYRQRRLPRPRFVDEAGFETLSAAMAQFARGQTQEAFQAVRPFARQLYVRKEVSHGRLAAALGTRLRFPRSEELLAQVCARLLDTHGSEASHSAAGRAAAVQA